MRFNRILHPIQPALFAVSANGFLFSIISGEKNILAPSLTFLLIEVPLLFNSYSSLQDGQKSQQQVCYSQNGICIDFHNMDKTYFH